MNAEPDTMLQALAPVIDQKCRQLQAAEKERRGARAFLLLCAAAALLPALLVLAGVSPVLLLIPLGFMAVCIVVLLPVLTAHENGKGGLLHE